MAAAAAEDYTTMTVVQIRELFKKRGIPTTGLTKKAQLIQRLVEEDDAGAAAAANDDDDDENHAVEREEEVAQGGGADEDVEAKAGVEEVETKAGVEEVKVQEGSEVSPAVAVEEPAAESHSAQESANLKPEEARDADIDANQDGPTPPLAKPTDPILPSTVNDNQAGEPSAESPGDAKLSPVDKGPDTQNNEDPSTDTAQAKESTATSRAQSVSQASEGTGTLEESRKRKRRSGSPPPSEEEIAQKKTKQEIDGERVILREDLPPAPVEARQPPTSVSGGERRFKDLVSPTTQVAQGGLSSGQDHASDNAEERDVEPAVHPATCALYVRNLKRPLRPDAVKAHLESLAQPTGNQADESAEVKEFFLDTIRTHCFAVFSSLAAASRVRSALHNIVWPPEGPRDPLWVDFVPEEKVAKWISAESSSAAGGRGAGTHKWEVQYDQMADGSVATTLRDVTGGGGGGSGGGSSAPRRSVTATTDPSTRSQGPQPLPKPQARRESSARNDKTEQQQQPQPASFAALDSLFKPTQAKPKLYFQPVAADVAEQRLSELDALTTRTRPVPEGGSGYPDSRRYTFENNILVDNGPEFGLAPRRPRPRRFGGGGGGGRGGGGGGGGGGGRW